MKILITGGMGFIGTALARLLLERGHDVVLLDSLSAQVHGQLPRVDVPHGAQAVRMDVRQLPERLDVVEGCEIVYHLAAETGTAQSMYKVMDYVGSNDLGTAALLQAMGRCSRRPRRVILASSRSVYGEGAYTSQAAPEQLLQPPSRTREQLSAARWEPMGLDGEPLACVATPETLAFAPGSVYAATKASQELLLASAASAIGFHPVIFRFQNVYGEGQSLLNPYTGIISIFFNRARQGLDIPIYEDGLESRDFVHVEDIVRALVDAATADVPPGLAINLGSGDRTSVCELAEGLLHASGLVVPCRITGQFRVGDIRHCFADLGRARRYLGYEPAVSLHEGLTRFARWASTQPVHEDMSARAVDELRKEGLTN